MYCTNKFNNREIYILSTLYVFLRKKSDVLSIQNKLIGFYNRDEKCLSAVRAGPLNKAVCASSLKG
jgi:hypothetical protein